MNKPFALACVAVAAVTLSAFAQTSQLNPTVKVLSRPQSPVPPECATDIDTTAPALEPEPQPAPSTESVPPSNSLRASLRRVQVAAEGDDYAGFKAALAEARRAVASHPAGGERNAANDALQVYTDIARVWDYAMSSPSGSFFDATVQGGSLLSTLKRYPDYGKSIASETIVSGNQTLYPSRETRRFLARESSRRLSRLGVSVPAKMAGPKPEWPRVTPTPAPPVVKKPVQVTMKTKPASVPKTKQANVAPKPATHKPVTKTASTPPAPEPKPPVKIATATAGTAGVPPASTSTHETKPLPGTTTAVSTKPPATATSPAPTATAESTAGGTPALPGTSVVSTQPPTTTTTTTTTTATTATDTTATAAPDTATTGTTAPAEKPGGNTNLIWAIVLILVGIGVLVILFRASD